MRKISPLAYVPRPGVLQSASVTPVLAFLGAYVVISFMYSDPAILIACCAGAAIAGYGCGVSRAVRFSFRLGLALAVTMTVVNCLVTDRGETVLVRMGEWPLLGTVNVTLEAIAAGAVIGIRAMATMVALGVYSACVDPDRVLQAFHGFARRSALTATLVSRLVPLAAADQARLREAASLRGPGAAPVGRGAMAQRLLSGSLDRAVDVAATLELRGYGRPARRVRFNRAPSRYDGRLWLVGLSLIGAAVAGMLLGVGDFEAYPAIEADLGPVALGFAAAIAASGFAAWRPGGPSSRERSA